MARENCHSITVHAPQTQLINGGVYLAENPPCRIAVESDEPVSIEEQLFPNLLKAGSHLYGFTSSSRFIDIGIPEDYERAASVFQGA